jgi:hypothetical protein
MSGLKSVLEKSSENIDGQNTIRAINIAKTVDDRVREYEIAQEEEKLKGKKPEPSLQEILYGVMKDMGQISDNNIANKVRENDKGQPNRLEEEKNEDEQER